MLRSIDIIYSCSKKLKIHVVSGLLFQNNEAVINFSLLPEVYSSGKDIKNEKSLKTQKLITLNLNQSIVENKLYSNKEFGVKLIEKYGVK